MSQNIRFAGNGQFAITVPDLAQARRFFSDVLGLPLDFESDEALGFDAGGFKLYVNREPTVGACIPSFDVPDVVAAREYLVGEGATIVHDRGKGGFYFSDPFGLIYDVVGED
jgi:catechol 2,3-dioxygenase-like lactoylglutathione lyase family enzyme